MGLMASNLQNSQKNQQSPFPGRNYLCIYVTGKVKSRALRIVPGYCALRPIFKGKFEII
jgi:hypothetical protein